MTRAILVMVLRFAGLSSALVSFREHLETSETDPVIVGETLLSRLSKLVFVCMFTSMYLGKIENTGSVATFC